VLKWLNAKDAVWGVDSGEPKVKNHVLGGVPDPPGEGAVLGPAMWPFIKIL